MQEKTIKKIWVRKDGTKLLTVPRNFKSKHYILIGVDNDFFNIGKIGDKFSKNMKGGNKEQR